MKLKPQAFWIWKWVYEPQKNNVYVLHTIADTKDGCWNKVIDWLGIHHMQSQQKLGAGDIVRVEFVEDDE